MSYPPRVPRKLLWPPYMNADAWQDLADAVDVVFGNDVDSVQDALKYMRETYIADTTYNPATGAANSSAAVAIQERNMMDASFFDNFDDTTERLRVNQLGLRVMDPSALDSGALQRLVRTIGAFWYAKGEHSFIDFISYILNTEVQMVNLWTHDYVTFYPQGDSHIGTPKWNGGTWYPTTHVKLNTLSLLDETDLRNLTLLFYDIANYNLILYAIEYSFYAYIVPASLGAGDYDSTPIVPEASPIVAMAKFEERIDYVYSL